MDLHHLLETAEQLRQVSAKSAEEFSSKLDHLVDLMNQKMLARADLLILIGEGNVDMMKDNHANHARFLHSIFKQHNPEVLVETVLWVFRAYRSRNFASTYWAAQLNTWIEIHRRELTPECFAEIFPYYNWMQINIPVFDQLAMNTLDLPQSAH